MDNRFIQESGTNVYTGCELLVKGALEGQANLLTGYPGSPLAEVFDVMKSNAELLKEYGILAQIANNEALGVARLNGSQMANLRAAAFMKNVGMHVAADALAISNMAGTTGGAVVVVGDDTWGSSTQVPADSRFLARHLYTPVIEPSTFQEIKDWLNAAFEISARSNLYVTYIVTLNQAEGGGSVEVHPNRYPEISTKNQTIIDTALINGSNRIILPPDTPRIEIETLTERFPNAIKSAREHNLNRICYLNESDHDIGFVASGLGSAYLEHALYELELQGQIPILKLGLTHPVDEDIVREFASHVREMYVVEEKRPLLEKDIKAIVSRFYQNGEMDRLVQVWGKEFPDGLEGIPDSLGLNPSILIERLIPLLRHKLGGKDKSTAVNPEALTREEQCLEQVNAYQVDIPARTPTFCPGCPHRDSASVFKEIADQFTDAKYMERQHAQSPVDLVFHGDIGCYSMLKYEPFPRLMHNLSGMALGGGAGAGIDPFIRNKQIVFMGDSTFFHGGMSAISDSIKNSQDLTYVILDNQTTGMTGHQPTPSTEDDILGNPTFAQDIEKVVEGLAGDSELFIIRTNPENRLEYKRLVEETVLKPGVKIIIADKECGITYHRRLRREGQQTVKERGFLSVEKHINITPEVCEFCLECTNATGCPGLKIVETDYGPKIGIDQSNCVSDGACARIKWACPSFEEVTITRKRPPRQQVDLGVMSGDPAELLPPPPRIFDGIWSAHAAGVGGMGIGTISKVLVLAGQAQGYHVKFFDKKGLAIRNGGVYTNLIYSKTAVELSPIIPYGKADLLIGMDMLEAVRGLDSKAGFRVASIDRTVAVVNTAKTDTVTTLIGQDDFKITDLEKWLQRYTDADAYFGADLFEISERHFGNKLYANMMLLGVAFQRGHLPLELEAIQSALKLAVRPADLETNQRAFNIGRRLAVDPDAFATAPQWQTCKTLLREKCDSLASKPRGARLAHQYEVLVQQTVEKLELDDETNRMFALHVYDLIQFENVKYARLYVEKVKQIYSKDLSAMDYRATKAAVKYLYKVMLIKDEVYVAHLLTRKTKLRRDKELYSVDESNGDKIKYVHLNRPRFTIMGRDVQWDMNTKNWQLNLMKRMRFLRRLLSQWHKLEKVFRDWYIAEVIDTFVPHDRESYESHVSAIEVPEEVRGYREVRYPKMESARKKVKELLGNA